MREVAALFVRADSVYKRMPGVDAWDIERDARNWPGGCPVVAHPPCRAWGALRALAKPRHDEKDLARYAVDLVRRHGGVLEHPAGSTLWVDQGLPKPGPGRDAFGGWTLAAPQKWWGHKAEKNTLFYVVGVGPAEIPDMPYVMAEATHVVAKARGFRGQFDRPGYRPELSRVGREATPPHLAEWLVELARRCVVARRVAA